MKLKKSAKKESLAAKPEEKLSAASGPSESPMKNLKKILVPIDFSECSRHALGYARAFAIQFKAELYVISVLNETFNSFDHGNAEYASNLESRRKTQVEHLTKLAMQELEDLPHKIMVRTGKPFQEIVQAACDLEIDLIVISTHGQMGLPPGILGSTAERVVRYAPCPVLTVRQNEREFASLR